jgi:RNA polymerase sigma-70 factor (ECF subfamily)
VSGADDELMARVRAGDTHAFTGLYERHGAALLTLLARLTGDRALAEDLLQETFVRVYQARDAYEPTGHFRAYLFTIARRLVIDWHRRRRIAWAEEPAALESMPAPERAEHVAEAMDVMTRLERALALLTPEQREIILLSRMEGMATAEIARIVGATPGAVRVALHRTLRRLAGLMRA